MGWFSSTPSESPSTNSDPLRDLDPGLRDFLEKESPVKYKPSSPPPPPPTAPQNTTASASTQTASPSPSQTSAAPPQSLYPDGRYADLWSTYQPLHEVENSTKTDQERLLDVLEGYKQRKADIGRAALENCALEQTAVHECWSSGGVKARMTMCRAQNKSFERCYLMQNRFLKALGYLSSHDRPAHVDEQIQMHADTLYHRMLDQEKAIEAAKEAGQPAPSFAPLLSQSRSAQSPAKSPAPSPSSTPLPDQSAPAEPGEEEKGPRLTDAARAELRKRTKNQPQLVKELEERAMRAEAESDIGVAERVTDLMTARERARKERREKGQATVGDTISGWLGW